MEEGAGAHDPTLPACHIIHVRTSELNKVFTVGEATLSDPELEPFCGRDHGVAHQQAGNSGAHLSLAVAEV